MLKRFLPFAVVFLLSCEDENATDPDQLKEILGSLQKQRDSLLKTQRTTQENIFDLELQKPADSLVTDSTYQLQQESLRRMRLQIQTLDKEIEEKQSQIYLPK